LSFALSLFDMEGILLDGIQCLASSRFLGLPHLFSAFL